MKAICQIKRLVLFVVLFLGFAGIADIICAQSISDYNALPPFVGASVKPNILLLLDNSGSMNLCAYQTAHDRYCQNIKNNISSTDYDKTKSYSGYFEGDQCYLYDSTGRLFTSKQVKTGTPLSCGDTATSKRWDGNFLNWLTMRRIDIAKWALTGGQCATARVSPDSCSTLHGQNTTYFNLQKKADVTGLSPFSGIRCILIGKKFNQDGQFWMGKNDSCLGDGKYVSTDGDVKIATSTVTVTTTTTTTYYTDGDHYVSYDSTQRVYFLDYDGFNAGNFTIAVTAVANPVGVIQTVGDRARLGLMVFNDWSANSDGGRVTVPVGADLLTLVQDIELVNANTATPLAESLYEATRYFAQIPYAFSALDYTVSRDFDPYCYSDEPGTPSTTGGCKTNGTGTWVSCCNSFILVFTDGEPTRDQNIPSAIQDYAHIAASHATLALGHDNLTGPYSIGGDTPSHYIDDVAYWAHITDLRPDNGGNIAGLLNQPSTVTGTSTEKIKGMQNLNIYAFLAFDNVGTSSSLLKDAAKVGSFGFDIGQFYDNNFVLKDATKKPVPDPSGLGWDEKINETGAPGHDGIPDNYFSAENATTMQSNLLNAFNSILEKSASGSAVSFVSTSSSGEGAIYQSYFYPTSTDAAGTAAWVGYLQALFLDDDGELREGADDHSLIVTRNNFIRTSFNSTTKKTEVRICKPNSTGKIEASCSSNTPLSNGLRDIKPIWEAGKILANKPASSRNLYTWLDSISSPDGVVDNDEVVPFTVANSGTATSGLWPYLRATSATESQDIINFIRGENVSSFRNRQRVVDVNGTQTTLTWKLGDIINSNPISVGTPVEAVNTKHGDTTYTDFFKRYKARRNVIYVGANDGMLHAFNGGYFHVGNDKTSTTIPRVYFTTGPDDNTGTVPLGDEMWGFIPQELLPQLKFLTGVDYDKSKHIYFVDGSPRVADARIFTEELECTSSTTSAACIHPHGWGTILIASMRMGGGLLKVNLNGINGTNDTGEDRFRSAYLAFDITNPEAAFGTNGNKLMWVFKDNDLGFTTSFPAIVRVGSAASTTSDPASDPGIWYAVFGSGPLSYKGERVAASAQNRFGSTASEYGQVYVVDLISGKQADKHQISTDKNAFMGDPIALDLRPNFKVDSIYIGDTFPTTSTTGPWGGKMNRILTGEHAVATSTPWSYSVLFDAQKPVLVSPTVTQDELGRPWVLFGTGRLFSSGPNTDQQSTSTQALYGIKEAGPNGCWDTASEDWKQPLCSTASPSVNQLLNVTDKGLSVTKGGLCTSCGETATSSTVFDAGDANGNSSTVGGWFLNLNLGERIITKITLLAGVVMVPSYTPSTEGGVCSTFGTSNIYATYYKTGTAYASKSLIDSSGVERGTPYGVFGLLTGDVVKRKLYEGTDQQSFGIMSRVAVITNGRSATGIAQTSNGEIVRMVMPAFGRPQGTKLFLEKTE